MKEVSKTGVELDIAVLVVFAICSFIIDRVFEIDLETLYNILSNLGVLILLGSAWIALDIERAATIFVNAVVGQVIGTVASMLAEPIIDLIGDFLDFLGV